MTDRTTGGRFRDRDPGYSATDPEDDYSPEDSYSHWNKGRSDSLLSSVSKNSGIVLGVIGAAVFILICLIVGLPMLKQNSVDPAALTELDGRLRKLEARLAELESARPTDPVPSFLEDRIKQLASRLEKLESASSRKADHPAPELEKPDQPVAAPPAVPAAAPPVPTKPNQKTDARYHDVKPKETLYSIARTYGLSVDELRKLNGMSPQDVLKTGQKLRVTR